MLEYIIISGIACMVTTRITGIVMQSRLDSLGYVSISEAKEPKKVKAKDYIMGVLGNFIPVFNNIATLALAGTSLFMGLASDELISSIFDKLPSIRKASEAKEIYERRIKSNNFDAMADAMRIDGADKATIKEEMAIARKSCGIPNEKTMRKIRAMSDAELWLLDVEMNVGLTDSEKKELYRDYVRSFSKNKSDNKVIEKTLRMTGSMNR